MQKNDSYFSDKIEFANKTKKSGEIMNHYKQFKLKEREMIKYYLDIGKKSNWNSNIVKAK